MKIYAISDYILTPYNTIETQLKEAILGGISVFQFRDKLLKDDEILPLCEKLGRICLENNVDFIINDRINLALTLQNRSIACGLHLGKDDEKIDFKILRKKINGTLGISCYGDINRAIHYENLGVDYVAFGSIFQSKTKVDSAVIGIDILHQAKTLLKKAKICAIGGIDFSNIAMLKNADMIAMIAAVWSGDIGTNLAQIKRAILA